MASPRLRMNRDMRTTPADGSQRMLNALEVGMWHSLEVLEPHSVIFEAKDGAYEPIGEEDVLKPGYYR